jgi:hypothetical protein
VSEWARRRLTFSGFEWLVKGSDTREGPGPNLYGDGEENVWVDAEGRLHLRIDHRAGVWRCAEVIAAPALGYGKYTFSLGGGAEQINDNAVLGLFTWDNDREHHHREIDVELSRWGDATSDNCQFVVQPYDREGKMVRFEAALHGAPSSHSFDWRPGRIEFESKCDGKVIRAWTYTGPDVPPPGKEQARINLWLFRGDPPSDGREMEVVVTGFAFVPAEE